MSELEITSAESPNLSRSGRVLRMWAHIGARRNTWIILIIVLVLADVVLLDTSLRGETSISLVLAGGIALAVLIVLSLAPRSVFVPYSALYATIESEHDMVRITGKLYRFDQPGQGISGTAVGQHNDRRRRTSRAARRFSDAPFDLRVGEDGRLMLLLKYEAKGMTTRLGSSWHTTTAAASAQVPMTNPEYWGVSIRREDLLEACPGILFARWDRPALRLTHHVGHKREQVYVTFSNLATYGRVVSFLRHQGVPVRPPLGLVLSEIEDFITPRNHEDAGQCAQEIASLQERIRRTDNDDERRELQWQLNRLSPPTSPVCQSCLRPLSLAEAIHVKPAISKAQPGPICPECLGKLSAHYELETKNPRLIRALAAGMGVAVLGGVVWAIIQVVLLALEVSWIPMLLISAIGLIGVAVGAAVGIAIHAASGNKRGYTLQVMALLLTLLAFVLSEYLVTSFEIKEALRHEGYTDFPLILPLGPVAAIWLRTIAYRMFSEWGIVRLVIWVLSLVCAWIVPKRRRLRLPSGKP